MFRVFLLAILQKAERTGFFRTGCMLCEIARRNIEALFAWLFQKK